MDGIDLGVLGPLRLLVGGVVVPVERVQTRAFLALLALTPGRPVSVASLSDALWPTDRLPRYPREALRTIAARARHAVGDRRLVSLADGYTLEIDPQDVDLHRYTMLGDRARTADELAEALALWRGDPFADCGGVRTLRFRAEVLQARRLELAEQHLTLMLEAGDHRGVVATAGPLLVEHRSESRFAMLAAAALRQLGRGTDARLVLEHARQFQLDDDPNADVDDLDEALRNLSAAASAPTADTAPAPRSTDEQRAAVSLAEPAVELVGRAGELALLDDAARLAASGGRTVVIVGEAGIGKTALAASFAARLGWQQRVVRCGPGRSETLAGLGGRHGVVGAASSAEAAALTAHEVIETLRRDVEAAPVLVIVDDLHWADEVDLRAVRSMVRSGLPAGSLLVLTVRPPSTLTHEAAVLLTEILADPTVGSIELRPLSVAEISELVRRLRPTFDDHDTRQIAELTSGNAFAIEAICSAPELLDGLSMTGGGERQAAVVLATEQRLAGLGPECVEALELVALLDAPLDISAAATLTDTDLLTFARRLRPAFDAHLLVEHRPGDTRFDHDLTRQAVAQRVPPVLRRAAHDGLARHYLSTSDLVAAGRHLVQALPDSTVENRTTVLRAAADAAFAAHRPLVAIDCLDAAEALLPDRWAARRIALRRGLALEHCGRREQATALYDRLAVEAEADEDLDGLARAALAGIAGGVVGGDLQRLERLQLAATRPTGDERLDLEVVVALAGELAYAGRPLPGAVVDSARRLASDAPGDQALLLSLTARALVTEPVTPAAARTLETFEHLAIDGGELTLALRALELRCAAAFALGDLPTARRLVARLDARLARTPSPRHRWASALYRALLADLEHGIRAAEGPAAQALELGQQLELPDAENAYAIFLLAHCLRTGVLAHMEPIIRGYVSGPRSIPAWHALHAASLRAAGDPTGAADAARRFREQYTGTAMLFPDLGLAMEIIATVGDPRTSDLCSWAVEQLDAWRGLLVVVGAGAGCVGPVDVYLACGRAGDPERDAWAEPWSGGPWQHLTEEISRIVGAAR